jgi:iron complex transport system substrate-binding protein
LTEESAVLRRAGRAAGALALWLALATGLAFAPPARALQIVDDRGVRIDLAGPAQRIVTLAPYLTELLFAAGAGERIVGTVAFSEFPEAAQRLPRVGDARALDLERIVALKPDLVLAWLGGSSQPQLDVLAALGLPVYYHQPRSLDSIAETVQRFGALAGSAEPANAAANRFRARLAGLRQAQRGRPEVSVFHQVWDQPLMTIGGSHPISEVLALCGGRNIFAAQRALAPQVAIEAVLEADPEVIGGTGLGSPAEAGLGAWLAWPHLRAVARGNLYVVPPDLISQYVPRVLDGAELICAALERARGRRP